ncbi:MAG TPA: hypothetical protein VFI31_00065 [Pirellulales bacterium]|nr:hypothetical protein [Pirellulales bacterium]
MQTNPRLMRKTGYVLMAVACLLPSAAAADDEVPATPGRQHRWYNPRRYVERFKQTADEVRHLEIVEMISALAHGQPPDEGKGWFHPGQSRYGWQWLADRYDRDGDGKISSDELPPEVAELAGRLDRDQNGKIEKADFDWSSDSPYVKQAAQARRLFGSVDRDRNGRITGEEWRSFFDRAALDSEVLTPADLQAALFPPQPESSDDDPTPIDFLRGFASGELGSISQGPKIGGHAPDFELADHQGQRRVRLSNLNKNKPVVLIFGSFT